MAETFPKVLKGINSQIQDQQTPNKLKAEKSTLRHIIVKLLKTNNKEKILKELEEKIHCIQMNKLQMISCQKFFKTEDKVVTSLKF